MQQSRWMYGRLVAIGLFTMILVCAQSEALLAQALPPVPPGEVVITRPIDIVTDCDGDGEPDELTAALDYIEGLEKAAQAGPAEDPEAEARVAAARSLFFANLPYSAETRAIQQQTAELIEQLAEVKDPAEAMAIQEQIQNLSIQLENDPAFVAVDRVLGERLEKAFRKKSQESISLVPVQDLGDQPQIQEQSLTQVTPDPSQVLVPLVSTDQHAGENNGGAGAGEVLIQAEPIQAWAAMVIDQFMPDPCTLNNPEADGSARFGLLQPGWLMFMSMPGKINNLFFAKKFAHIGMYHGATASTPRAVYEANPGRGARLEFIDHWLDVDQCIAIGYNQRVSQQRREEALAWVEGLYGTDGRTPYSFDFAHPSRNDAAYCSSVVWRANLAIGWDVDSDASSYVNWVINRFPTLNQQYVLDAVAPDEIYLDPDVLIISEGTNPPQTY
ncbi:MAG TPA: YiiX/YebB-like N1pC/P60 family cysteine hydrolase [Caldilineaceae bacterium]|nr:YiiX/YebB-like N1pC/P60 family cysteine hydrolase [Caldilineaceae bacterium]